MKTIFKDYPKIIILIIIGILVTTFSFIYEYAINYNDNFIRYTLLSIDIILLLINMFYLSYILNNKVGKSLANSMIFSLIYLIGITGLIMCLLEDSASLLFLTGSLKILIYLAPSIIVLLPIIYIVCLILGG